MLYYLTLLLLFLLIGSERLVINNKSLFYYGQKYEKLIFLITALFLCAGYMTGSDWRSYELLYLESNWYNFRYYLDEQLFYILIILSKYLFPSFIIFLISLKLLVFFIIYNFIKKYSPNIFSSYFFYIPLFGLFLFIDNPLRYMVALGFITFSYKHLLNHNFLKFILFVFVGAFFHYTVLIFIPFYFLKSIKIHKTYLSIIFLAWMLLFSTDHLLYAIDIISNNIPIISLRYSGYIIRAEEVENVFSLGSLMNVVFFFWIIFNKNKIENNLKHGRVFFAMSIAYLFLTKLSVIFPTGFRFTYLFAPFFVITLTYSLTIFEKNIKQILYMGIALYILLYTFKRIDQHYVYIPYSNYIINAATGNLYDYNYRFNYNRNEYYKRKGANYKN